MVQIFLHKVLYQILLLLPHLQQNHAQGRRMDRNLEGVVTGFLSR